MRLTDEAASGRDGVRRAVEAALIAARSAQDLEQLAALLRLHAEAAEAATGAYPESVPARRGERGRTDTERLDWLERQGTSLEQVDASGEPTHWLVGSFGGEQEPEGMGATAREAIDEAMREPAPEPPAPTVLGAWDRFGLICPGCKAQPDRLREGARLEPAWCPRCRCWVETPGQP